MEEKSNAFLEQEKPGRLMRKYAVPCVISMLVAALYNIVDQIFIANADYLGSYGNAANTAVFPLTIVALAIAVMIGDGACAFVSISLGRGEAHNAHKSVGNAVVLTVLISIIITAAYFIFQDPILTLFGGSVNEETMAFSKEYFTWITAGIPFYMFGQAMNPIIRSDGSPKFAMISTLAGAFFNIIFDPILIFGFKWGMMGAAVATIAGQIITAILGFWYLFHMKAVSLEKSSFGMFPRLMRKFLPLGLASFLSQFSLVISMAAVNSMCTKYAILDPTFGQAEFSHIPLAVLGIVMKFFQIVISIAIGIAAGCIPVVGYNLGAGRSDRVKQLFKYLLMAEALVGFIATLIVEILPYQILGIFGAANESEVYTSFGVKSFRIYLCLMVLAVINKGVLIFMQSLGKAVASTAISMLREIIFGAGLTLILPIFLGLTGILISFPIADLLTFAIALPMIITAWRQLSKSEAQQLVH